MPDGALNEIWVADLITAWKACGAASSEDRLMVASLLGFTNRNATAADRIARTLAETGQRPQKTIFRATVRERSEPELPDRDIAARLVVVQRGRTSPSGEGPETPGPALPLETDEHIRYEPQLESLFETQYQRQILYALGATLAPEGDFDVDSLVREITSGRPVRNAPRKPVLTLRRGLQLLVDRGDGMSLFFGDQLALLHALRRLVGPERVQLLHFAQSPARGAGPGPRHGWTRYAAPPPRTKVIVVSDFGISPSRSLQPPSTASEWIEFADIVRVAECDLLGLVPYPPRRWPSAIAAAMKLVQWDRATRFSVVRQRSMREHEP